MRVRRKYNIPLIFEIVQLGSPEVCRVVHTLGRNEGGLDRSVVLVAVEAVSARGLFRAFLEVYVKVLLWYMVMLSPLVKVR